MSEPVKLERDGRVAIVSMNVPRRRNALAMPLVEALDSTLRKLMEDPELRAIVLRGEGGHFCAGGDLSSLDATLMETRAGMQVGHRMIRTLVEGRLPVIAAVEGNAYGAGFSIAMACDHVIADAKTSFCAAFGRVGLMPDYGLLWTLPKRIGLAAAREMVLFCEAISGTAAHELGIVDRLSDEGGVLPLALERAHRLASAPPASLATIKAAFARAPMSLDVMLAWEADTQTLLVGSEDFKEGARAFLEKRTPVFVGR